MHEQMPQGQAPQGQMPQGPQAPQQMPEDDDFIQGHPAVVEIRQLQGMWRQTGLMDPRLNAYQNSIQAAQKTGMDPRSAVIFAAKTSTGK